MNDTNKTIDAYLEVAADVLLRTFILGIVILTLSGFVYLVGREAVGEMADSIFGISAEQYDLVMLILMGMMKMVLFTFFLFPYIAIRWTRTRRN